MPTKREELKVTPRTVLGKKVKKLRKEGLLPANIYGKDIKSTAVELPSKDFKDVFKKVHETGLVDLKLDSQTIPVLIHNVQIHPLTQDPIHADFYKVNLKEKITTNIPISAVGEPKAVADKKGLLLQVMSELEVEALPTDLPEKIEVSVENLKEIDEEIKVSEIKVSKDISILTDPTQIVFKIGELVSKETEEQVKAEEAQAAEAAAETAAEEAKAPSEGEKPAEGEKQPEATPEEKKE